MELHHWVRVRPGSKVAEMSVNIYEMIYSKTAACSGLDLTQHFATTPGSAGLPASV